MANPHDMAKAEKTYGGFISMIKWAIPIIAVLVAIVLGLIT
tara:strand:+ start:215 stop:337 length:123 start_codon:yes stop_codon:yes gene_type:complete